MVAWSLTLAAGWLLLTVLLGLLLSANRFWHFLIKRRLTAIVWRPLVECTRLRHVHFRRRLAAATGPLATCTLRCETVVPAGV